MKLSNNVKKRFVKDYNLPIVLFDDDHFNYFIELYDPLYRCREKLKMLETVIERLGSEENFFKEAEAIQNNAISSIKNSPVYENFNNFDMNKFKWSDFGFPEKNIYTQANDEKSFISIDMKHANYQALKKYNPELVNGYSTYDEWIKQFTNFEYFINSKQIRQVIFGNVNPKRQQTIQKFLMNSFTKKLLDKKIITEDLIESVSSDELVIKFDIFHFDGYYDLQRIIYEPDENFSLDLKFNVFNLKMLKPYSFFVKQLTNSIRSYEFKCVPSHFFPQAFKYFFGLQVFDKDLDFYFENCMAQFKERLWIDK